MNNVVCERILDKDASVLGNFHGQAVKLLLRSVIDTFLHNATAMLMAGDNCALSFHGVINELLVLRAPSFMMQHLLDYMVTVNLS